MSIAAEFMVGFLVAVIALIDVFSSVLVPGPSKRRLSVARRVTASVLPVWRHATRTRGAGSRKRLPNVLAPMLFGLAFSSWMLLMLTGFGLMFHASADSFSPPLKDFGQAVYVAGSSLLTLGVSEVDAHGVARWMILLAALCGFAVITSAITFILQVQSDVRQRETGVLTLSGMTGSPPSGIALLESFAALQMRPDLGVFFREWRDWSTAVLHSHVSNPVLVFFHSMDAESDWLSALEAVLDAATLIMCLTDEPSAGSAALMHRAGSRTVSHLCDLFDLQEHAPPIPVDEVARSLVERLVACGYAMLPLDTTLIARLSKLRADYDGRFEALSRHLGAERAGLKPEGRK
jgi:hypothetical protein